MPLPRRRIERARDGTVRLRLPRNERELLRSLPAQLRELLGEEDDPSLGRLFPPAYPDDDEADDEYERLTRRELLAGKLRALAVVEETADAERLDDAQLEEWVRALNDLRLVLGTRLGVTEDSYASVPGPGDPRAPELALFGYLTWLQEQGVQALSEALPEGGRE